MISSSQRPLPDNTRHSQQTNILAPGGIRTHDLSRWAAAGRSPAQIRHRRTLWLIQALKQTPLTPTSKFASLDITNMYSNIPIKETKQVLENILKHNPTDPQIKLEILNWYEIITKQNYFLNNNEIIIQKDGLAMGAPSSSIIPEIFLQNIEHTHLPGLAEKHKLDKLLSFCRRHSYNIRFTAYQYQRNTKWI